MRTALRRVIKKWRSILTVSTGATLLTAALSYIGALQSVELGIYDLFMRWRAIESTDDRIVLVTIDDTDLEILQQGTIADRDLARAIETIAAQRPSAIGIDLDRSVPVPPGHDRWRQVAQDTPNLIGIYKLGVPQFDAPDVLDDLDRVAFRDLPIDPDRRQRRAILSFRGGEIDELGAIRQTAADTANLPNDIRLSLAMRLSGLYLAQRDLYPDLSTPSIAIDWGKATFRPLRSDEGGYAHDSMPGYQLLIDYRNTRAEAFPEVAISTVLNDRLPDDLFRDKIVLLGNTAAISESRLQTPLTLGSQATTPSLYIHANIISQIVSAVLDGRDFLQAAKPTHKLLWIWIWTIAFNVLCVAIASRNNIPSARSNHLASQLTIGMGLLSLGAIAAGYLGFRLHWWLPIFAPIVSGIVASAIVIVKQRNSFAWLATTDSLTQLANRSYFDEFLDRCWHDLRSHREISLLLCDVDFFKRYNDTYGHQAGDACLNSVAHAMANAVRGSDLVARYGGEEFAVVMPACPLEMAEQVAERMCQAVRDLGLEHRASDVAPYVTISCGIASTNFGSFQAPAELIEEADRALYLAKEEGRNCCRVLVSLDSIGPSQPTTDLPDAPEADDDAQPA